MPHSTLLPGEKVPSLSVPRAGGGVIDLAQATFDEFAVVFFYRGVHCPLCSRQLAELNARIGEFEERGFPVFAVSMDDEERLSRQQAEWEIDKLEIGYGMEEATARNWGLYLSKKEKDGEPPVFNEPAIAVVKPDGTLYSWHLQNEPFARPSLDALLKGLDYVSQNSYPIRGALAA